jgi:NAD-dependent deacetylase
MAKVVIFSGAGISAESGISTFRDSDGLWENYRIEEVCTVGCLVDNREATIDFYNKRRTELAYKKPNHAHHVLSKLKQKYPNNIAVITQNVDDMFERAGLDELLHLHGELTKLECETCGYVYEVGYHEQLPSDACPKCASQFLRPFIVMFGEAAPMYANLHEELSDCEMIVVIGTSGNVIGVNGMASFCERSILNNLEPSPMIEAELFSKVLYKKATEAVDEIASDIEEFLR